MRSKADQPLSLPIAYTDSDWAGAQTDRRRSVSGYIFTLAEGPIAWKSRKQTCVALSSNEAEYVAASETARQATWIRWLLMDMGLINGEVPPITLRGDNVGAFSLIKAPTITKRSKHIDVRFHYTREAVEQGIICLETIPSYDNLADGFTKLLRTDPHERFVNMIGLN